MEHGRHPIEIANLVEVEKAVSVYVGQGRSLRPGLVLDLHGTLMTGVPEEPGRPLKPGRFRDVTDHVCAEGVEYLTGHMSPAWRIEADVAALMDGLERGELGRHMLDTAGSVHYRFVRIHPFCDGNGRMARAISTFLLATEYPDTLLFERPLNRVILDHREDYVGILEYCDSIYEDLKDADIPEEEKLWWAERAFVDFHTRAFLQAYHEHNESVHRGLVRMGLDLSSFPSVPLGVYDLSLEEIKASNPWNDTLKSAAIASAQQSN